MEDIVFLWPPLSEAPTLSLGHPAITPNSAALAALIGVDAVKCSLSAVWAPGKRKMLLHGAGRSSRGSSMYNGAVRDFIMIWRRSATVIVWLLA